MALKNVTPHVLSCSGYRKFEQSLMVKKEQSRQGTSSENVETVRMDGFKLEGG